MIKYIWLIVAIIWIFNSISSFKIKNYLASYYAGVCVFLCSMLCLYSGGFFYKQNKSELIKINLLSAEYGYFWGQQNALSNDFRISFNVESNHWEWTKNPWDDGTSPLFKIDKSLSLGYSLTNK